MKIPTLLVLAFLALAACNDGNPDTTVDIATEVGEEVGEFFDKVGPDEEAGGEVPIPPATISIDETAGAVNSAGGLLKLSPAAATGVIDRWIETLRANPLIDDNEDMVRDLTALKLELGKGSIDGKAVSRLLDNLADETEAAARDNDYKPAAVLAEILEEASEALD